MTASLNARNIVVVLVAAFLLLLPLYSQLSGNVFVLTLFTRIVIFALAAASLNLIMGYGGMMSFGHAAYLGIGGYAIGILAFEGIGSIRGAFLAAIFVGMIDTLGRAFLPDLLRQVLSSTAASTVAPALSSMLIYLLMAIVLVVRPEGLFPASKR